MIKYGKSYFVKGLMVVVGFSLLSCLSGTNKNSLEQKIADDSASRVATANVPNKLPDDFWAVGLVYHRFGDNRYPSTNTPLDKFEEQLQYLNQNGFKTYTVSHLYQNPHDSLKRIFITVDDGLKTFYTHGWPLLKKYNSKATLFVNTESVGWGDYLNWTQLRELAKNGVEIGSHSHKHNFFLNVQQKERLQTFTADLVLSEQLFKDSLGFVPTTYAYPYGEFDEQMADLLKKRGYKLAFAQNSGVWGSNTHSYSIPRFPVAGNFVGLDAFKQKVNMKPFYIHGLSDFPIQMKEGQALSKVLSLDSKHNINSVNCFFNNKPNDLIYKLNKDSIRIDLNMPSNSRRVLITFTAKDNSGQWLWWSRLLVNTEME